MATDDLILIVDDDPDIRLTLKAYLEDCGYRVNEARDGAEGLEAFNRERPSLVVTDLRMPRVDGLTLIARLKQQCPEMPIIVITGTGECSVTDEALRLGAACCLIKPILDMTELTRAIASARSASGTETGILGGNHG